MDALRVPRLGCGFALERRGLVLGARGIGLDLQAQYAEFRKILSDEKNVYLLYVYLVYIVPTGFHSKLQFANLHIALVKIRADVSG